MAAGFLKGRRGTRAGRKEKEGEEEREGASGGCQHLSAVSRPKGTNRHAAGRNGGPRSATGMHGVHGVYRPADRGVSAGSEPKGEFRLSASRRHNRFAIFSFRIIYSELRLKIIIFKKKTPIVMVALEQKDI